MVLLLHWGNWQETPNAIQGTVKKKKKKNPNCIWFVKMQLMSVCTADINNTGASGAPHTKAQG